MNDQALTTRSEVIEFWNFRLVPATRTLTRNGAIVHLGDRGLDLLMALIERRGQVVSKKELFQFVWPKTFVEESNLRVNVAALRKALGDGQPGSRFIANVPGRDYAFIAEARKSGTAVHRGFWDAGPDGRKSAARFAWIASRSGRIGSSDARRRRAACPTGDESIRYYTERRFSLIQ